jgi:ATP synthase protein I
MVDLTSVGWMMALPIAAGVLVGHALDRRLGTGTFWTLALLGAGLVLGAWQGVSAARRILRRRKGRDD